MFNPSFRRSMIAISLIVIGLMSLISLSMSAPSQAADEVNATLDTNESLSTAQRRADEAQSLYWAAEAKINFDHGDPFTAYTLAIQSNSIPNPPVQAQRTLNDIAYASGPRMTIGKHVEHNLFTKDWRYMFSLSNQSEIVMWEVATGKAIQQYTAVRDYGIEDIALSPDERSILAVGIAGQILVWDVVTGKEIHRIEGNGLVSLYPAHAQFSPDGSKVVTFGNGPDITAPNISVWDIVTGKELYRLPGSTPHFNPDGKILLIVTSISGHGLEVYNARTGEEIMGFGDDVGIISDAIFSPNGTQILSFGSQLVLWSSAGRLIHQFTGHDPNASVDTALFSLDGKTLASSDSKGGVIIWDMNDFSEHGHLNGFDSAVDFIFSADGRKLLTESVHIFGACADCASVIYQSARPRVILWDVQSRSPIREFTHQRFNLNLVEFEPVTIDHAQLSLDGEHVATLSEGSVILWDTENGQLIHNFTGQYVDLNAYGFDQSVNGMVYSPDRQYGITMSNANYNSKGVVILYDLKSSKPLLNFDQHTGPIRSAVFSPDGQSVVSGSTFGEMIQWDVKTRQIIRRFEGQAGDVMALAFSPDGHMIVSAASNEYSGHPELVLWDVVTGKEIRRYIGHSDVERIYSVAFSPDGRMIVSGATDDSLNNQDEYYSPDGPHPELILWDVATGKEIRRFVGHRGNIYSVAFSPDGTKILSGGGPIGANGELFLWDIGSGMLINRYIGAFWAIRHVSFSEEGHSILSVGDYEPEPILWRFDSVDETIQWTLANRVVPALTCEQRQYYRVAPVCNGNTLPLLTPFPTLESSPTTNLTLTTPTLTATVTPTIPTLTPSLTPVIPTETPTTTPSITPNQATLDAGSTALAAKRTARVEMTATNRAGALLTATAVTFTPTPTSNPSTEAVVGSQRDVLDPPTWKVWRYQGTANEVVTITLNADKPDGLLYAYFVLRGQDGTLLETVNGLEPRRTVDAQLQNYRLPYTGTYQIEIRSRGMSKGAYTLTIESFGFRTATPSATSSATVTPFMRPTFNVTTLTAQAAANETAVILTERSIKETITAQATITLTPSSTASATPLPPTATPTSNLATQTAQAATDDEYRAATQTSSLLTATVVTYTPTPTPT
ncbi:MAG: hypothetical protein GC179_12790 [Anaerolineaceae bacterium]|nr:hypothetical protein [Anaerolineaceae bacterium]